MPQPRTDPRDRHFAGTLIDQTVYMLDPNGRIISWNAVARRLDGLADDEVVGSHFSRLYTEAEREAGVPVRVLEQAAREGRSEREGWRVRGGGRRIWVHALVSPMRDREDALVGFVKVTRDITRQREMLLQAHRMEAVGHLTAGLVHDFNNLLAVLLASLQRLRPSVKDEGNATDLLDTAVQVAQRGAALTRRMLAFARRREQAPEPVDVSALISDLLPMLRQAAGPLARVETRCPVPIAEALADPSLLEMALLNLVINARDAMPDGGSVVISACEEAVPVQDGCGSVRCVCLTVADQGQGMDEATLARVMEPLFTTKAEGKGTGLGLPMIRDFAERSGGHFDLRSRPGEGTCAEIRLPVQVSDRPRGMV
ncbi:two-component system sensor histidine kinase NtrB [Methylobacterium radiodurans]|nr:PAS domain-containing hybrid sensor histidine kinase/response regulator [Methylobacterium radiodurans]